MNNINQPITSQTPPSIQPTPAVAPSQFPYLWIGLGALAVVFAFNIFVNGLTAWVPIVIYVIQIFVFWGLAKLFKAQDNLLNKSVFIVGAASFALTLSQFLTKYVVSGAIPLLLYFLTLIATIILLKYTYWLSWLKSLGLFIVNGIVIVILFFVLIFAGLFSIGGFLLTQSPEKLVPPSEKVIVEPTKPTPAVQPQTPPQPTPPASPTPTIPAPSPIPPHQATVAPKKNFVCLNVDKVSYSNPEGQFNVVYGEVDAYFGSYVAGNWSDRGFKNFQLDSVFISMPDNKIPGLTSETKWPGGILNIECSDGKKVAAAIPDFVDKNGEKGFAAADGTRFQYFYIAEDGSTYFDKELTKLARQSE